MTTLVPILLFIWSFSYRDYVFTLLFGYVFVNVTQVAFKIILPFENAWGLAKLALKGYEAIARNILL
jgi:hypothetical protein